VCRRKKWHKVVLTMSNMTGCGHKNSVQIKCKILCSVKSVLEKY